LEFPGTPPPALLDAVGRLDDERQEAFFTHLIGGTSADYLSDWMKRAGAPIGATTIKNYRRTL